MHSSASRAMVGINSGKRACEEPNARFMSEDKNEPNASAARSGTVIMILPNAFSAVPIESPTPRSSRGDLACFPRDFPDGSQTSVNIHVFGLAASQTRGG